MAMLSTLPKVLYVSVLIIFVILVPSVVQSACDQPDAPDCSCFLNSMTWNPGAASSIIQDIADELAGMPESCNCPGTWGCTWDPNPSNGNDFKNAGKPYYQIVLGRNFLDGALWAADLMTNHGFTFPSRTEWCSETISYWHREAGIPYSLGYRNEWHEDWMVPTVLDLRFWYAVEEYLGARGRWVNAEHIEYSNFQPGINAPLPGAYIAIAQFRYGPPASWGEPTTGDHTYSHSLMVNEMTVHRDLLGNVYQVEVALQEGNSRDQVRNDRVWTDLLSLAPQGSQWVSTWPGPDGITGNADDVNRKIYGFGIDLDEHGNPIYDASRLHEVIDPIYTMPPRTASISMTDSGWNETSMVIGALTAYASALKQKGGPSLVMGGQGRPLPDGQISNELQINNGFYGEILIDLKGAHPLAIEGLELVWGPGFLPRNYSVEFFYGNQLSATASVPPLANLVPPVNEQTPVPVHLPNPIQGVKKVRIFFPDGTITDNAFLQDVRFLYRSTRWQDAPGDSTSIELPIFVDVKPGSCPNPYNPGKGGDVPMAILGSGSFDVRRIDPSSITLGGISPIRWAYEDVATPFIGPHEECHDKGKDGKMDLTLKFDAKELEKALGLASKAGSLTPVSIKGRLKSVYGAIPFQGQDWLKILKK
jgi:hypothetical protein